MKFLIAASLGALALSMASGSASGKTPTELLQSCQAVIKAAGAARDITVEIPVDGLACWHYMAAIQNMSVAVDEHGRHLLGVCAPQDTTMMQYVRIFVRYAQRHREQETDNAAVVALRALLDAFPCGTASSPESR
jgi:hypothetical protein